MRIGLIGAGRWGRNAARAIAANAKLAWVADADGAAAKALALEHGVPFVHMDGHFGIGGSLFPWGDVAGIWCATPIETHEIIVHAALVAGKHVLCEKPLARTKAQAEMLAEEARRSGLVLMCDFTWCGHRGVMDMLDDTYGPTEYRATRHAKDDRGFDPLEDLLPHDVALAGFTFGLDQPWVPALRVCVGVNGAHLVTLDYGHERRARLSYSYESAEKVRRVEVFGETWVHEHTHAENTGENLPGAPEPLSVIVREFISAITEQREPTIGGAAEFVHVAAVIEAAKQSRARGGEWVDVER